MLGERRERPLAGERQRRRGGEERAVLVEHRAADVLAEALGAAAAQADEERHALGGRGRAQAFDGVRLDDERQVGDAGPQGFGHVGHGQCRSGGTHRIAVRSRTRRHTAVRADRRRRRPSDAGPPHQRRPGAALRDGFAPIRARGRRGRRLPRGRRGRGAARGRCGRAARRARRPAVRDDRPARARATSTRRCTSRAGRRPPRLATRSPTSARSCRAAARSTARPTRRAVTVYAPDENAPLHPPVLSEGAASLLPGVWRPAVLWTLDLDATGALVATARRARRGPQRRPAHLRRRARGRRDAAARGRRAAPGARARARRRAPRRPRPGGGRGGRLVDRPLPRAAPDRGLERADLAAHGHGRGRAHAPRRHRDPAHPGPPEPARARAPPPPGRRARPRRSRPRCPTPSSSAASTPRCRRTPRAMHEATAVGWAAGYTAFDGEPPADAGHFAVAASTPTRPRRCAACRTATSPSAAWPPAPARRSRTGCAPRSPTCPAAMTAGAQRAGRVERGVVDLVEAAILAGREGERFDAVVIEDGARAAARSGRPRAPRGRRPAARPARSRCASRQADPATRTVLFAAA